MIVKASAPASPNRVLNECRNECSTKSEGILRSGRTRELRRSIRSAEDVPLNEIRGAREVRRARGCQQSRQQHHRNQSQTDPPRKLANQLESRDLAMHNFQSVIKIDRAQRISPTVLIANASIQMVRASPLVHASYLNRLLRGDHLAQHSIANHCKRGSAPISPKATDSRRPNSTLPVLGPMREYPDAV